MGPSNLPIPLFRPHSRWFPICRLVGRVFRLDCCQIVYLWLLLLLSVKGKKCISILETIRTLLMLNFFPRRSFCFVSFRLFWFCFLPWTLFRQCYNVFAASVYSLLLCFSSMLKAVKEILSRRFAVWYASQKVSPPPSFPGFSFLIFFSISASSRLSHITTFGTLPRHLHFFAPGLRTSLSWPGSGNLLGEPKLLHLTLIFVQSLRDNGGDRAGSLS